MTALVNKIDFVVTLTVADANPNGDPLNANLPRTDMMSFGEMSDVSIKRKIRNRLQDAGHEIFVQSNDRITDGNRSLEGRYNANIKKICLIRRYTIIFVKNGLIPALLGK